MTESSKQYGEFTGSDQLALGVHRSLRLDASDLKAFWRRCSMTADFWSRYGSLSVPSRPSSGWLNRDAAFQVIAYLLNELFENCAKFTAGPLTGVLFDVWELEERIVYRVSNHIRPNDVQAFVNVVKEKLDGDLEELYFKKLEENAESGEGGSGLGYLTLMKDYGVRFGFAFEPLNAESVLVHVQALVSKKEI